MKQACLIIIILTLAVIYAQNLPRCVQDCITSQCPDGTDDTGCLCDPVNETLILQCVTANCSSSEVTADASLQSLCASGTNVPPTGISTTSVASTTTSETDTISPTVDPAIIDPATVEPTRSTTVSSTSTAIQTTSVPAITFPPITAAIEPPSTTAVSTPSNDPSAQEPTSTTTPVVVQTAGVSSATPSSSSLSSHRLSSSAIGGIVGSILGVAILLIACIGCLCHRRRRVRTTSDSVPSNGDAQTQDVLWQNNEKVLQYDANNEFNLQQRVATPASQIVTVAGPEYHSLPYSTLPRSSI